MIIIKDPTEGQKHPAPRATEVSNRGVIQDRKAGEEPKPVGSWRKPVGLRFARDKQQAPDKVLYLPAGDLVGLGVRD